MPLALLPVFHKTLWLVVPALLNQSLSTLEAHFPSLAGAHLADAAAKRLEQSVGIVSYLEPIVLGIGVGMPSLLMAPFLAYFFLRDGRRFRNLLCRAVPNAYSLGVVRVVGETVGIVLTDPRLSARHRHARCLRRIAASEDLIIDPPPHRPEQPGIGSRTVPWRPAILEENT